MVSCLYFQFDNPVYEATDEELYYQKNGEVENQYTVFHEVHENDTKVSLKNEMQSRNFRRQAT